MQRWASLQKQQSSITVYLLPSNENKLPFLLPTENGNGKRRFVSLVTITVSANVSVYAL
jgi:hypothetical protein